MANDDRGRRPAKGPLSDASPGSSPGSAPAAVAAAQRQRQLNQRRRQRQKQNRKRLRSDDAILTRALGQRRSRLAGWKAERQRLLGGALIGDTVADLEAKLAATEEALALRKMLLEKNAQYLIAETKRSEERKLKLTADVGALAAAVGLARHATAEARKLERAKGAGGSGFVPPRRTKVPRISSGGPRTGPVG